MVRNAMIVFLLVAMTSAIASQAHVIAEVAAIEQGEAGQTTHKEATNSQIPRRASHEESMGTTRPLLMAHAFLALVGVAIAFWFFKSHRYQLPPQPDSIATSFPFLLLAMAVGMWVLMRLGAVAAAALFNVDAATIDHSLPAYTRIALGAYAGALLFVLVWVVMQRSHAVPRRVSGARALALGLATMTLALPLLFTLSAVSGAVVELVTKEPTEMIAHDTLELFTKSAVDVWYGIMLILVIFIAPTIEEVMYRGMVQRAIVSAGVHRWTAIAITSIIFAAAHGGIAAPHVLPTLVVLSMLFGWAYEKTGRLIAPIAMHVLFNAVNFVLATMFA